MIRANDEYWDSDRASYDDELNAWRERTAIATVSVEVPLAPSRPRTRRSRLDPVPPTRELQAPRIAGPLRRRISTRLRLLGQIHTGGTQGQVAG